MELTSEQLEVIREASREIEFRRITVNFTGSPSNIVEIIPEKHIRFRQYKAAEPPAPDPANRRGAGRIIRGGNSAVRP